MTKYLHLIAGATALTLASSAVFAQELNARVTTSQTTTTAPAPVLSIPVPVQPGPDAPAPGYNTTKTERTIEGNGTVVDRTQSYQSDLAGSAAKTTTQVIGPDGSRSSSWREEWVGTPSTSTTITRQTTTTTQ